MGCGRGAGRARRTVRGGAVMDEKKERLKRRDREVIRTEDLDDATLEALKHVEAPAEAIALNYLMDDTETR